MNYTLLSNLLSPEKSQSHRRNRVPNSSVGFRIRTNLQLPDTLKKLGGNNFLTRYHERDLFRFVKDKNDKRVLLMYGHEQLSRSKREL